MSIAEKGVYACETVDFFGEKVRAVKVGDEMYYVANDLDKMLGYEKEGGVRRFCKRYRNDMIDNIKYIFIKGSDGKLKLTFCLNETGFFKVCRRMKHNPKAKEVCLWLAENPGKADLGLSEGSKE